MISGADWGANQPHWLLWSTASTIRAKAVADSAAPTTSRRGGAIGRPLGRMRLRTIRMPTTTTVSAANTRRHVNVVVTHPPMSGPAAIAAAEMPPMIP